jgi:hypothetical protein
MLRLCQIVLEVFTTGVYLQSEIYCLQSKLRSAHQNYNDVQVL